MYDVIFHKECFHSNLGRESVQATENYVINWKELAANLRLMNKKYCVHAVVNV